MDCRDIKKYLPSYRDDAYSPEIREKVRIHLRTCSDCQKEMECYERSWAALKEVDELEPEPGYVSRFWTRVAQEPEGVAWWARLLVLGKGNRFVPALATAAVIVIVAFLSLRPTLVPEGAPAITHLSPEDAELLEEWDVVENLEMLENLELLEDDDFLEDLDAV